MNVVKFFAVLIGLLTTFSVGFSFRDITEGEPVSESAWAALNPLARQTPVSAQEVFKQHYSSIASRYYKPVDKDALKYSAMQGMFSSLGDPHTNFLEPKTAQQFSLETQGDFVGIGARLDDDPLGAKIVSVFEGSPAKAAGIESGDVVVAVGGKEVAGIAIDEIVTFIRGEEGTVVDVTVLRQGRRITMKVRRARVAIPTVESKSLDDGKVGYIAVSQFSEITPGQFRSQLEALESSSISGLVIDLRGNPGGLLESAVEMLGCFVDNRQVVTMKGKGPKDPKEEKTPRGKVMNLPKPVVVLVNEDSASAAEIFAGVLKEYGQGVLVGKHTYGKASVQNVIPLRDGASVKITTHRYYLPQGKDISRRVDADGAYVSGGLKPDVEVTLKIDENTKFGEAGRDSQLDAALSWIKERQGLS
jgi:carboxyl-terminal processing protease